MGMLVALICHRWPGNHCGLQASPELKWAGRAQMHGVLSHSSWAACTSQEIPADTHAPGHGCDAAQPVVDGLKIPSKPVRVLRPFTAAACSRAACIQPLLLQVFVHLFFFCLELGLGNVKEIAQAVHVILADAHHQLVP